MSCPVGMLLLIFIYKDKVELLRLIITVGAFMQQVLRARSKRKLVPNLLSCTLIGRLEQILQETKAQPEIALWVIPLT